jgi:LysM repeat protein
VRAIQVWNHLRNPNRVVAGQPLVLYSSVKEASPANRTDLASSPRPNAPVASGDIDDVAAEVYRVRRGDTVWSIARAHGMSVDQVKALNPQLRRPTSLKAGEKIFVRQPRVATELVVHRVAKGETLQAIASRYGTTVGQIRKWNRMDRNESTIRPGDRLKLYP